MYFRKNILTLETIFKVILFIWIFSIPLKDAIYHISTALLIGFFLIHVFYYKQKHVVYDILSTYKMLFLLLLLFLTSMTLSSALGISEKSVFVDIVKYFFRYIFILFVLFYFYKQNIFSQKWLIATIFIGLTLHSLDGLYQYITGFDFLKHLSFAVANEHLTGAVYSSNPFGILMSIGTIISLVLFFDKNNYTSFHHEKIIYLTVVLLFLFTLFHSQSRASWIMLSIFLLGYFVHYIKANGIDKKLFFTLSFLLIITITIFLFDDNLSHRFSLLLEGYSSGRTSTIWPYTIEKIKEAPLLGYGLNTYQLLPGHSRVGVHNLTLELLLYTGIIGLFLLYTLIITALYKSIKNTKFIHALLLFSYIILLQFDGSLIDSKVHLNIFIIILFFIYV